MRSTRSAPGVAISCATLLALLASTARAPAQSEAWREHGVDTVPGLGTSVAFLGDLDGDGVPEFVAGGPSFNIYGIVPGNGRAMVFSGASGALRFDLTGAVAALFGAAVASAGDVDGDGVDDLAVGAPLDSSGGTQLGLVTIFSGASGATLASIAGSSIGGSFGSLVDDAGDVDHDGIHDLLIVEQADSSTGAATGSVRIYSGASFSLLHRWIPGNAANHWNASGAGDVNGDGTPDFIASNTQWPATQFGPNFWGNGGVWVFDGATGALLYADTQVVQTLGTVSGAGDVNGDGFDDFAYESDDVNSLVEFHVISGKDGSVLANSAERPESIRGGVDVNGDGRPDLLVGFPKDSTSGGGAGSAKVFDAIQATYFVAGFGTSRVDLLGRTSALLDDVDGDGTGDLIVGTGSRWGSMGTARILSGFDGSELRLHSGVAIDDSYAQSVAALPDLDGDAIGEYAIAVPGSSSGRHGLVEIRSGATGALLRTLVPPGGGSGYFGASMVVGLQPSGAVELAVGDPGYYSGFGTTAAYVFDAGSGSLVVSKTRSGKLDGFGYFLTYLGDVDGDGTGDWAGGAPLGACPGKRQSTCVAGLE